MPSYCPAVLTQQRAVCDVEHGAVDDLRRFQRQPADRLRYFLGPTLAVRIDLLHQLLDALGLRLVEKRRVDRAGRDGVHLDAVRAEIGSEAPGVADDAGLGDAVPEVGMGAVGGDRGEADDAPALSLNHAHTDLWYGVTKAGVVSYTRSFASYLGPQGIQVNAVAPGPIDTDLLKNAQPERIAQLMRAVYTKRVGRPEEVAEAIRWLALDAPAILNGAVIDVTDGCFLR